MSDLPKVFVRYERDAITKRMVRASTESNLPPLDKVSELKTRIKELEAELENSRTQRLFSPIKTTAEIEKERVLKLVQSARRESAKGIWGSDLEDFTEFLYDNKMLCDPEQQVKPLNWGDFCVIYSESGYKADCKSAIYELLKPYTIRGGDK